MPVKKKNLKCNQPRWTPKHPKKKKVVKACQNGKEKIVRYGAKGYKHNYSKKANKNFRARHKCNQKEKERNLLMAGFWACFDLWPKRSK